MRDMNQKEAFEYLKECREDFEENYAYVFCKDLLHSSNEVLQKKTLKFMETLNLKEIEIYYKLENHTIEKKNHLMKIAREITTLISCEDLIINLFTK